MKSAGLFITGTDTDAGKTFACGFLATLLRQSGLRCLYFKPIQCGPAQYHGQLFHGGDAEFVRRVLGHPHTQCLYHLSAPYSPHRAFALEGKSFNMQSYREALQNAQKQFEFVLVEGAGGIRVPIAKSLEIADLAAESRFPVLIVARPGLGTLNHTLLTHDYLQRCHLPIAGFAFSAPDSSYTGDPDQDALFADNRDTICARTGMPFWGFIPRWQDHWNTENASAHPALHYLTRHV